MVTATGGKTDQEEENGWMTYRSAVTWTFTALLEQRKTK